MWVIADVPEAQAALVRAGTPVVARAAAYPDRTFNGTRQRAAARSQRADAHGARANRPRESGGALKPGMFATVAFGGAHAAPAVLVPSEAVINTGKRNVVIVDAGNGRFTPVEVVVGRESGDVTEIRSGLAAGQRVVVSGQFLVDSEASLKGALTRIAATGDAVAQAADPHAGHRASPAAAVATPPVHKAEGVVRTVGDEVLIKHGAIPSAGMGAMTMAFKAPKGGVPKDVTPGTNVKFEFVFTPQGDMQLTSIVPVAPGAAAPTRNDRAPHPLVDREPLPRAARRGARRRRGRVGGADDAARRDSRPVRHAGDHPHDVSRARRRRSSRTRSPIR